MKNQVTIAIASLLSILLFSLHWAYEIAHGMETGGREGLGGIVILVVWLYGTLALSGRRAGYAITILGGIFGLGVLFLHMGGRGMVGGRVPVNSSGALFWVWTLIALAVSSTIAGILAGQGLWSSRRRERTEGSNQRH